MMKKNVSVKLLMTIFAMSWGHWVAADCMADKLESLSVADYRAEGHADRNVYRNPVQTLKFFGIQPTMTVVEISPGGGWYTEILAPLLRDKGTLYLGGYDINSEREYFRKSATRLANKLAANPEVYDRVISNIFDPNGTMEAAPEETADMVLTFRNTHNWHRGGNAQKAFNAMYSYLKPGGILGLVQHRGNDGVDYDGEDGYLSESQVIAMAEKAGFVLLDKSEINANPKDTKDHPHGVWSLPPALELDAKDEHMKEAKIAIGESDRMTMKFFKPVKMTK